MPCPAALDPPIGLARVVRTIPMRIQPAENIKKSAMNNSKKVDDFLSKLKHPLKAEMEAVRKIICDSSSKIEEDVKWGGPSFDYKEPMATFSPRVTEYVAVIFHKGELLQDKTGLLEPASKGKAYAKFRSMAEVRANKVHLETVVRAWVKMMDA
jgi:uncharacterized protein YdeI (YjbR/CyaY-like superfamily)